MMDNNNKLIIDVVASGNGGRQVAAPTTAVCVDIGGIASGNGGRPGTVAPTTAVCVDNGDIASGNGGRQVAAPTKRLRMYWQACLPVLFVLLALFTTCEPVPDHCGRFERYDPRFQFCFAGKAHSLCGGGEYNPLTEGCTDKDVVGTRCADSSFVPRGHSCGGYTLSTAAVPYYGGSIQEARTGEGSSYNAGEQVVLIATAHDGYAFAGWAGAVTSQSAQITVKMDDDKPIVAMFNTKTPPGATTHTLVTTAFPEYAGTVSQQGSYDYDNGTTVTITATAEPGYTFAGWSGASTSKSPSVTIKMDAGKTLVAMFTPIVYTLTVNAKPETGGTVYVNGTALAGTVSKGVGTQIEALAQAAEGYTFTGWSGAVTETANPVIVDLTSSNQTLTANFKKDEVATYTLSVNATPAEGGSVSRSPNRTLYDAGTRVTVTATAKSGYIFVNWTATGGQVENANSANTTITVNGDITLFANFQQGTEAMYTLMVNRNPANGGTVTPSSGQSHKANTPINITAAPAGNFNFVNWTVTSGGTLGDQNSRNTTVTLTGNATVTANFQLQGVVSDYYTLTAVASPAEYGSVSREPTNSPGQSDGVYSAEREVLVRATPNPGYKFIGWGGTTLTGNPIRVAMNSNIDLTAYFEEFTIAYGTLNDGRDGKVYKTVKIGNQTWMAENLNFRTPDGSWCYDTESSYCTTYGRLYTWDAAMIACPAGWHLPTREEWEELVEVAGGSNVAGGKLKSSTGWGGGSSSTDEFGFSALPGGSRDTGGSFYGVGNYGNWWSAAESGSSAYYRLMYYGNENVVENPYDKGNGFSVLCVQD